MKAQKVKNGREGTLLVVFWQLVRCHIGEAVIIGIHECIRELTVFQAERVTSFVYCHLKEVNQVYRKK